MYLEMLVPRFTIGDDIFIEACCKGMRGCKSRQQDDLRLWDAIPLGDLISMASIGLMAVVAIGVGA